jgi:hypothetical protein
MTPSQLWKWLKDNLGKEAMGGLTSTDVKALNAAFYLAQLIGSAAAANA